MPERVRERAGEFLQARAALRLEVRTRRNRRPDLQAFLARFHDLWELDTVAEVQRVLAGATGDDERRARNLLEMLVAGRAWSAAARPAGRLLVWRLNAAAQLGERRISLDEIPEALHDLPAGEPRRLLEDAWLAAWEEMGDLVDDVRRLRAESLLQTGYGTVLETLGVLTGGDLAAQAAEAGAFLRETQDAYGDELARLLPRLAGVTPGEARMGDRLVLDHASASSPPHRLVERLREMTGPWLEHGGAVPEIAVEEMSRMSASLGAVAEGMEIPEDVRLVHAPVRGRATVASFLEQLGRALHLAATPADLPIEFRWLGDDAVTGSAGRLLRLLLLNGRWLRGTLEVPRGDVDARRRLEAFLLLAEAREVCARLLAAVEQPAAGAGAEAFVEHLSTSLGVRVDPRYHLLPGNDPVPLAARLRAIKLGSFFSRQLRERYDVDWFRNPAAAPELSRLLRSGRRHTASELAVQLGSRAPTLSDFAAELLEAS
jgi:hypothetical protein